MRKTDRQTICGVIAVILVLIVIGAIENYWYISLLAVILLAITAKVGNLSEWEEQAKEGNYDNSRVYKGTGRSKGKSRRDAQRTVRD